MPDNLISTLDSRLLYFLSERLGWKDLNSIQNKAIPSVLDKNDTLILAPTASGKTEAALIPIFNDILSKGHEPLSVLYVSPLKALINDMYNRIERWADYFDLTVTKWHGDVSKTEKDKFIRDPSDFLCITPESLEVILMNKNDNDKENIFSNIKFILIDEIHYFADSDRGIQLNSLLNRIKKYTSEDIVTVGLSATVGNPNLIAEWINPDNPANIVRDTSGRELKYKVLPYNEFNIDTPLKRFIGRKVLIFVNSRATAELVFRILKKKLKLSNIYIHHGSINKDTREENERKFKNDAGGFMVSTSTLELGIDIGDIDVVVHLNPPSTVSSFSQRVGRSGRRSRVQRTIILSQGINLIVSLAELILHHENKVEEISISTHSKDIFFHQLLSSTFEKGKAHAKELYGELKGCYAFSDIDYQDCKNMLKFMEEQEFVDINQGYISLGYNFEKVFGKRNYLEFFAVFYPSQEYKIFQGKSEVGSLDVSFATTLKVGDEFVLAGKLWSVTSIDHNRYKVNVIHSINGKNIIPSWFSDGPPLPYLISRKVYDILLGNFDKRYLNDFKGGTGDYIKNTISKASDYGFSEGVIPVNIDSKSHEVTIFTFAGHKANNLLMKLFNLYHDTYHEMVTGFFISFKVRGNEINESDIENLIYNVSTILNEDNIELLIDQVSQDFKKNKFINYLSPADRADLKMNLFFDSEGLLDLCENNMVYFISNSIFKQDYLNEFLKLENEENNEVKVLEDG
ncbi:ATP-dependent helicase Lhr and Lhr-like helicase [Methanobrevibacter millerae]|uniref:ATP-dependent helicase Lhr and Lhr-like helicase n=1 Tax=Methanobrevibacter millerae TaxID=230361 RepID=A0A1G5WGC5_9EURY|nr:ATP-dependent helicase Lhr and Lhr-like helicase [Methanobrevibacter millerae]